MKQWLSFLTCALLLFATAATTNACVWGSFDASRVNYSDGTLNGGAHSTLRGIITSNGGTIAAGTPTLTAEYLAGVDVFYTSLLNTSTGVLVESEQNALHDWIAAGGVLIVTADIFPLPAYESFTAFYGVTGYDDLGDAGTGVPVADHPITEGVATFYYNTQSTFTYGPDALLLGVDGGGRDYMIVMEPGTGFDAGGRILVIGDHNGFTNSSIGEADNMVLVDNFVRWACTSLPNPVVETSWGKVKSMFQ